MGSVFRPVWNITPFGMLRRSDQRREAQANWQAELNAIQAQRQEQIQIYQTQIAEQSAKTQQENLKLSAQLEQKRQKIALGMARSMRSRVRGGLFGDVQQQDGGTPLSRTLG